MNRIAQPASVSTPDTTQTDEALRSVTAAAIGPRRPGVVYYDGPALVRVETVITNPSEARRILRRRSAQYAIEITDLHTGTSHYTGAVWTGSDRVLKAVA
jgi:hypothetical protein